MVDILRGLSNPRLDLTAVESLVARARGRKVRRPLVSAAQVQRRLSPDEIELLLAAYRAGVGVMQLASLFGINRRTVGEHLDRAGVVRRPKGLERLPVSEGVALYAAGWSLARLAERYGVSAGTVRTALLQAGAQTRPRAGRQ